MNVFAGKVEGMKQERNDNDQARLGKECNEWKF